MVSKRGGSYMAEPIDMILQTLERLENKIDKIVDTMVTKETCQNSRDNCIQVKRIEWSYKKITALAGLVTTVSALIMGLVKVFFIK